MREVRDSASDAPGADNGDSAEKMERGEMPKSGERQSSASSETATAPADERQTPSGEPYQAGKSSKKEEPTDKQAHKGWFRPEIPHSDSRGRVTSFDEGGVRVEEGPDGRIHVIHDEPS